MDFESVMCLDYETQHFGFHPRTYLDRMYNAFYESLFEALNELKNHLCSEYGHIVPVGSIHQSTNELFQELIKKLDKAIDKLELFVDKNVFSIPDHVILPEDEIHLKNPTTKEKDEELNKEIEHLKNRILEKRMRKKILKEKLDEQKYVKEELLVFKNKLIGISDVLSQIKGKQDNLQHALEKFWEIWNSLKVPPQMKVEL